MFENEETTAFLILEPILLYSLFFQISPNAFSNLVLLFRAFSRPSCSGQEKLRLLL